MSELDRGVRVTEMITFRAGGANSAGEVGDRRLGNVRVHSGRDHRTSASSGRVSAGLRFPVGALDAVCSVGRADGLDGRGYRGGSESQAGHHGTGRRHGCR